MDKLEKLEQKKAPLLPQSRRAMKLADKIATIHERERLEGQTPEPRFTGIETFDPDPYEEIVVVPAQERWPMEATPTPLPAEISNFEDPRVRLYTGMIVEYLGDPKTQDISEVTKQALLDAPFSKSFRATMVAFVAVQKYKAGKGPMYRNEAIQG